MQKLLHCFYFFKIDTLRNTCSLKIRICLSHLGFPSIIINPFLEAIQNDAARFILIILVMPALLIKQTLNLLYLSVRRTYSRICLFHKIYHQNLVPNAKRLAPPFYFSSCCDNLHKVFMLSCRTNVYYDSFLPRTCNDWNHLSELLTTIPDASSFKAAVYHAIC